MFRAKSPSEGSRPGAGLTASVLALSLLAAAVPAGRAQENLLQGHRRYEVIHDPITGAQESVAALAGPASGPLVVLAEAQRLNALTLYDMIQTPLDNAEAKAVTTNYIKNMRVAVEPAIQSGAFLIAKLDKDVAWYDKRFPGFPKGNVDRTDRREVKAYENYQNIKIALDSTYEYQVDVPDPKPGNPDAVKVETKVLVKARQAFKEKAKDVTDGLLHVLDRANNANYALSSIKVDSQYMAERLEALHEALFGLQDMADSLSRDGPHAQVLTTVTNQSDSLIFFVQVLQWDKDAKSFSVRPDTRYPIPLYPDLRDAQNKLVVKKDLQIEPYGPRGASQLRLPVGLGDRLVVRVATMGQTRDRIRFQAIKGQFVKPESSSFSRGFYYLGYDAETGQGHSLSRWYSADESYAWTLSQTWQNEAAAKTLDLLGSDGKGLRDFPTPVKLTQDRLEWTVPDTLDKVTKLEDTSAEIKGSTHYVHEVRTGINIDKKTDVNEDGQGRLKVFMELW